MLIRTYHSDDQEAVVRLWEECGLTRPWNDPYKDITRKVAQGDDLFLVGECDQQLMATAMAGFDAHRGWLYYLAVDPAYRHRSYGQQLLREVEARLLQRDCPKLNLLVRDDNTELINFYRRLGYKQDAVSSLGRRLINDN